MTALSFRSLPVSDLVYFSLGEYVAQTVAGVLTLQDALLLVAHRARLMAKKCASSSTSMMAVNLSAVMIGRILASSQEFSAITISCYNSPYDHVLSGPVADMQALKAHLDENMCCQTHILPVGFGYHSNAMCPVQDDLTSFARRIAVSPPIIPIISNVYGKLVLPGDASVFSAQYYSRHCIAPVLFDDGIRALVTTDSYLGINAWIETGPHAIVLPTLKRHPVIQSDSLFLASMRKGQHPLASLHSSLARLYASPFEIKWRNVFSHLPFVSNISLPTYPWSNASFWVNFEEAVPSAYNITPPLTQKAESPGLPYAVLHAQIQSTNSENGISSVFETPVSHLSRLIAGHLVGKQPLCPASTYQELVLAAVESSSKHHSSSFRHRFVVLHDIDFQSPLVYAENKSCMIQTSVVFGAENVGSWKVTTNQGEKIHARGSFQLQLASSTISKFSIIYPIISHRIASITSGRDGKVFTTSSIYQVFFPRVVTYGRHYQAIQILTTNADGTEGYATIQLPSNSDRDCFVVHPILMDAMLHVAGFMANIGGGANDAFICSKVGFVEVIPHLIDDTAPYGVYVNCAWLPGGDILAESYTLGHNSANQIVAHIEGIYFRKVPLTTLEHGLTLAAASTFPETLKLEGTIRSSTPSITLPCSQHFYKVKPRVQGSKSRDRTTSVTSNVSGNLESLSSADSGALSLPRFAINAETDGTVLALPGGKPEILPQDAPEKRLPIPGDNPCPSSDVKPLLAAVLGLEMNELREDTDLELLGLDSLASIEAHHALQSHFYIVLPSDFFSTHTSVKAIQSFITSRLAANCKDPNGRTLSYSTDIPPPTASRSEPADFCNPIPISVQKTGKTGRAPLFLIHDGSGLVKYIDYLPSLGRDLWGIHNPNFMKSRPWESVESMAAEYANYMIKAAGHGPVLVGGLNLVSSEMRCQLMCVVGWSFGGIIAFEVARRLLKSDVPVEGVVLIDSPSPLNHVPLSDALIDTIVMLNRNSISSSVGLLVKQQFQMNSRILLHYDPTVGGGPYPQLVLLCSCDDFHPHGDLEVPGWLSNKVHRRSAVTGWEMIVGKPIKFIDVPGHHFQLFHEPYVRICADSLAA